MNKLNIKQAYYSILFLITMAILFNNSIVQNINMKRYEILKNHSQFFIELSKAHLNRAK